MHPRLWSSLRRNGRAATSFQVLEPGLHYWFDEATDACVAYRDTGRAWVTVGGPLAAPQHTARAMQRFASSAAGHGRRLRWFGLEATVPPGWARTPLGAQPHWHPRRGAEILAAHRSLREQLRRATAKGVTVRALAPAELGRDQPIRPAIEQLVATWLRGRAMPPLGFVVRIEPFAHAAERRYLIAVRDGTLVGLLVAVPIYARDGWLLEDALRHPSAPNGTMETLFFAMLERLADEGATHVTFGLAPLADTPSRLLGAIARVGRPLYDFAGLRAFKAKLRPDGWTPVWLATPPDQAGAGAVLDVLRAFAEGSLTRFAGRTVIHRAPLVACVLAALLVPWTALLLIAAPLWFPHPVVQWGWAVFDLLLFVGLLQLARRWSVRMALTLGVLATIDLGLGLLQLLLHTRHHIGGFGDAALVGLALLAPAAAAWFLFTAARRYRAAPSHAPSIPAPPAPAS